MKAPRIRYHLNVRALLILTGTGLMAALGLFFLWRYQENRTLKKALEQIKSLQEASEKAENPDQKARDNDLALRHLYQYLASRPDDPEGLAIEGQLLTGGQTLRGAGSVYEYLLAQLFAGKVDLRGASAVYEHLLRIEPKGSRAREARRRLAAIYVILSDQYRYSPLARLMPEEASKQYRYHAAELSADQLLDENAKANPPVDDAESHQLRAMALEGQIVPNSKSREVDVVVAGQRVKKPLEEATIVEYQNGLALDPGDMIAAQRLAEIYRKANKTGEAINVLNRLRDAHPESTRLWQIRYSFFKSIGDNAAAAAELEDAYKRTKDNVGLILTAVENALRSDPRSTAEAKRWFARLEAVSNSERIRDDPAVLMARGTIEFADRKFEEAIRTWRMALERTNATDIGLTRRLILVLLDLGRDDEARELTAQYRRLVGEGDPALRFIEAIQDEHAGRYSRAVERLELARADLARNQLPEEFQESVNLALGRCHEKQGEWLGAEKTYREAIQLAPKSVALRQSLSQLLLMRSRPEDATRELEQALASNPDQPALLVTLAQTRMQQQRSRSLERKNWRDFDTIYNRAVSAAPQSTALALIRAERLAADPGFGVDQAISFLAEAVDKSPRTPELVVRLTEYLISQGQIDRALQVLAKASDPKAAGDRGILRIQRALVMSSLGQGREARALLVGNIDRLSPGDQDEVWRFLVLLCKGQGDTDTTRAAYNEWARLLPNDPRPKLALLEMEIEANHEEAISTRLKSLRPHDEQDDFTWRLAQARDLLRQVKKNQSGREVLLKEADSLVESVLRDIKIDSTALLLKGQILEEEGAREKAVDSYSLAWARGNVEALIRLIDLLARLGRRSDLDQLRQADTTKQLDQIVAATFLQQGNKQEAARIIQQSLSEKPGRQAWQVGMLEYLGEDEKAESALRAMAEQQSDKLEPWLALVRFQTSRGSPLAAGEARRREKVEATIAEIKKRVRVEWPELLDAQCRWAAADWRAADQAFEMAVNRYPDVPNVQAIAARYFEERGRPEAAEGCLRRLLNRNPKDRSLMRQLAIVLSSQPNRPDFWKQALDLLGPETPATNTPEERLARAIVLGRSGDLTRTKQAISILEALVADIPAENNMAVTAREMLVKFLLAIGQAAQASKVAAISAARDSNSSAIALYIETLIQSKQFDAADEQRKRLEKLDPGNPFLSNLRARLIVGRVEPTGAATALENAYLAREKSEGAEQFGREIFPMILGMGGTDSRAVAERLGRRLAEHNPALSWMPALVLSRRGEQQSEVLTLCRTAIEASKNPADLREACRIVLELAVTSRTDATVVKQASEILGTALQRAPETDELLVMGAMIHHLEGRFEEEVRLYRTLLVRLPRNPVVLNNMAWALSEGLNQPSEALEKIDELIRFMGRSAESLDTRGVILTRLHRLEDAAADLEEAVRVEPTGPHHFHLARVYKMLGRDADFRKALDAAQRAGLNTTTIDPTERAAFEALLRLESTGKP